MKTNPALGAAQFQTRMRFAEMSADFECEE